MEKPYGLTWLLRVTSLRREPINAQHRLSNLLHSLTLERSLEVTERRPSNWVTNPNGTPPGGRASGPGLTHLCIFPYWCSISTLPTATVEPLKMGPCWGHHRSVLLVGRSLERLERPYNIVCEWRRYQCNTQAKGWERLLSKRVLPGYQ